MSDTNGNGNGFTQKWGTFIQTISLVTIIVAGLWAVGINPIQNEIVEIRTTGNSLVTKEVFTVSSEAKAREMEELKLRIHELELSIIPKSTHQLIWDKDKEDRERLQNAVNDLRKDIGGTFTVKDAMSDLQKRIDRLEVMKHPMPDKP